MPRLNSAIAAEAQEAAEEGGPQPIPAGIYVGRLEEVTVSDKEGGSGFHYWIWKFQIMDEGYTSKSLKTNTSLAPQARFAFGNMFKAFGVSPDTDTDELIGKRVMMHVTQTPIQKGPRTGQIVNQIDYCTPYDPALAYEASLNPAHDEDF